MAGPEAIGALRYLLTVEQNRQLLFSLPVDKIIKHPLKSPGQARVKKRNIVSVKAKKDQPQQH
ncbi:MAG: hypothetical protein WAM14_15990 [Candidatus Nitrosopolaris sp.]